jgi:hypothetical protein
MLLETLGYSSKHIMPPNLFFCIVQALDHLTQKLYYIEQLKYNIHPLNSNVNKNKSKHKHMWTNIN